MQRALQQKSTMPAAATTAGKLYMGATRRLLDRCNTPAPPATAISPKSSVNSINLPRSIFLRSSREIGALLLEESDGVGSACACGWIGGEICVSVVVTWSGTVSPRSLRRLRRRRTPMSIMGMPFDGSGDGDAGSEIKSGV